MSKRRNINQKTLLSQVKQAQAAHKSIAPAALLPLGAMLLAGSMNVMAQQAGQESGKTLATVEVKEKAETPEAKTSLRATETTLGKGSQKLRDIPQSITVVTERLMDDRNYDDFREVLHSTAGVTFQAGETGEEDIRLRGFSLVQAGDIYVDGLRDASIYERDTFNYDRVEVLKGSASMLFGRGSTGGVVNQVNKQPYLMTSHEVKTTVGTGNEQRLTGDFNFKTGENAAFRLNVMTNEADNYGAKVSKKGVAPTYRWGIGTADEFSAGLYHLEYDNRPNYNHPWILSDGQLQPTLEAKNFYGLNSDYNRGKATYGTLSHIHRFTDSGELKTTLRHGIYARDLWSSVIRFQTTPTSVSDITPDTVLTRQQKGRVAFSTTTLLQSDYSDNFVWMGKKHKLITGVDFSNEDALRNNNFSGGSTSLTTTVGTPFDGDSRLDLRGDAQMNKFNARTLGVYAQDTLELTPTIKLIGGLRNDNFNANYLTAAGVSFDRSDNLWSPRLGALYQPSDVESFHVSYGSSYNTSGDTYQFGVGGPNSKDANTPAEQSRNFEIGSKRDLFDRKLSLSTSVFYTEKYNERNTDPDTAATQQLLSGKRHAKGVDVDIAGRISPKWDAFLSWTWIPEARIDVSNVALNAAGTGAQVQGDRPGLTPKHSASLWTTYRLTPKLRIGGGLNYRGEQNPEGARHVTAQAFTTLDVMAEYTINEKTSLKLNITNLTDKLYADSLYRGFYSPGAARSIQMALKLMFD
ncbi:MAG: TonB-dependent siderophore receptor [Gammaproteobacteria bacterium]|nr:TonB-dependent siderophore receptor [Gammaproteobacteria bacterium]MBU0786323.1 TonB-dependent siderophore receptor [Gammaproteobacteria bacterium]MBU0814457.1 TonB-dependent siderophore receptor [Gammaproteobacteria bacterium]MBU1786700.1 TonB-dependent siderophore receptor [Gammaproteobacteria bacterium]